MQDAYYPKVQIDGADYFSPPYSLMTLNPTLYAGMVAIGTLALFSVLSCITLISFILWRAVTWRDHYKTFVGYNQYVVLVLNLLLADLQQGAGFLIDLHWVMKGDILAPTPACAAQGWLIHSGDVSSGFFVLAIALHTTYTAVYGGKIPARLFVAMVLCIWIMAYLLTGIGIGIHGEQYFVRAGSWCWVSAAFQQDRLGLHYIWVFIFEFGTILLYVLTFFVLRHRTRNIVAATRAAQGQGLDSPNLDNIAAVKRVTSLMVLYPCVYVLLTLPLSVSRMWSMAHGGQPASDAVSCVAGALLTSCGWVDCLLYTVTRKRLLNDTMPKGSMGRSRPHQESELSVTELDSKDAEHTWSMTRGKTPTIGACRSSDDSADDNKPMVYQIPYAMDQKIGLAS